MNIIGIVCEYNPFHKGHEYHINMSRRALGEEALLVCVMSGDFMQRGEPAMYSKFARARAACLSGANLVIELPVQWALSSAESFARGSVALLDALGADYISFGSETGELEPLEKTARALLEPELNGEIKELMSKEGSLSYAAARQIAAEKKLGADARQLELPNNILGIEYLKAIYSLGLGIKPMTVKRMGSGHDKIQDTDGPKSASDIRRMIQQGRSAEGYIPQSALNVYEAERAAGRELKDKTLYETAVLSRLRMFDEEYYAALPDGADGAGIRLYKAVRSETGLDAVLSAAKTRRYALSRIRRMCLCACLGIKEGMNEGIPPYARVLAADKKGLEILKAAQAANKVPIVTKPASVKKISVKCAQVFATGAYAHDFYTLAYRAPAERKAGMDWKTSPFIVSNI